MDSGEIAVLNVDVLLWDVEHQGCAGKWPQLKTHKFKSILFQAGENRFICPINCMFVAFASDWPVVTTLSVVLGGKIK